VAAEAVRTWACSLLSGPARSGASPDAERWLQKPFARGRAHSSRAQRGVEHPQMRNGGCQSRSHVGVLTPLRLSEEWSIPRCGTATAKAVRTWACLLLSGSARSGASPDAERWLPEPFARGRAYSSRAQRGVEHPQMRNGGCKSRPHVGVLTPLRLSEEWSIPRCGTVAARAVRTWACSLPGGSSPADLIRRPPARTPAPPATRSNPGRSGATGPCACGAGRPGSRVPPSPSPAPRPAGRR